MTARDTVLSLFAGQRQRPVPCFSGLSSVTAAGLDSLGLHFNQVHNDPGRMAAAAQTAPRLFGFASAVVPFDLGVEAEALGAGVDFHTDAPHPIYPSVTRPLAATPSELRLPQEGDVTKRGRIPLVCDAIRLLKEGIGSEVAIGAWVPGPFTLAVQVVDLLEMTPAIVKEPEVVGRVLDDLTGVIVQTALAYRDAGADFITVHEMGGSPGFIGPRPFERVVLPRLQRLLAALPAPRVLSVCGNTNRAMPLLAQAGADALSVDQLNDLARSRQTLGDSTLLFGNIDPVGTLINGDEAAVRQAVRAAITAGVDAVWPGCDLAPGAPLANLQAMVDETRR